MHNCSYCYARSLLDFRGLWNAENPRVADIQKIRRKLEKVPPGTILRLGGMTDCFQPMESQEQITYQTIEQLNEYGIGYLIVTKSHLAGEERYRKLYDPKLAHIQITITCFDDKKALAYEKASSPSKRLRALLKLQEEGFDVNYFMANGYGIPNYYEEVFLANNEMIESEPEVLKGFLRASAKGFEDFKKYPDGCLAILMNNQNEENFPLTQSVEEKSC